MSDQRPGSAHDDGDLAETAELVGNALNRHAERFEPGHDAYARLAVKVNDATSRSASGFWSWLPTPRLAVAVTLAAVALIGGVALVNGGRDDESVGSASVVVGDESSTTSVAAGAATAEAGTTALSAPAEATEDATDDGIGNSGLVVPLAGGIARASKAEAATAFLEHVGIDNVSVTVNGDLAAVHTVREGGGEGPEVSVLELFPVAIDDVDRWIVGEAKSSAIVIEAPLAHAKVRGETLAVTGQGTGFESTVDVEVRAATDGRPLALASASAGNFDQLAPFSAAVPMVGSEQAWVIVRSSSGTDEVASSFAAVPISSTGSVDTATYRVVRIAEDDPDNGLNLRAGPGTNNDAVAVLDRGAAVTRRPDAVPTRNGSSVWWPVTDAGGTAGWAASQHLAAEGPLTDDALTDSAAGVLRTAFNPDAAPGSISSSPRLGVLVVADGAQVEVGAASVQQADGWTEPLSGVGGRSLADLAAVSADFEANLTMEVDGPTNIDPSIAAVLARYLGGLHFVTVDYVGSDASARTLHLAFEAAPTGGPALVGILVP